MSADAARDEFAWAHGFKAALRLPLIERHDYEVVSQFEFQGSGPVSSADRGSDFVIIGAMTDTKLSH